MKKVFLKMEFTFDCYNKFCNYLNIKPSKYSSLKMFRRCYDACISK